MRRFSVILNNYNYGRYIGQAIESVLSQSYTDYELIIVDDGSTDDSRAVISSYRDSRIRTVFKDNGGQADALNAGFAHSRGQWIALLDSDDWWDDNKLERVNEHLLLLNEDYALVQHMLNDWDEGQEKPYRNKHLFPSGNALEEMKRTGNFDYFVATTGLIFSRNAAEKIFPVPLEFRYSADAYLMRTAVVWGMLFTIPEVLGRHRLHRRSFTNNEIKDAQPFITDILIPELNEYYRRHAVDLQLTTSDKKKLSLIGRCIYCLSKSIK